MGAFEFGGTIPVTLANISTRLGVETGDNVLIGGFIVSGTEAKKIIVRAIGPSLPLAGETGKPDPRTLRRRGTALFQRRLEIDPASGDRSYQPPAT